MFGSKNLAQSLSQEEAAFATLLANYDGYKRVLSPESDPDSYTKRIACRLIATAAL